MNETSQDQLDSTIISVVNYSECIAGINLVNDVSFRTNCNKDTIWERIKNLCKDGKICKVEFSLQSNKELIRAVYFPQGTTIFSQRG